MSEFDSEGLSPHDCERSDLEPRTIRALTEVMSVLPDVADAVDDNFGRHVDDTPHVAATDGGSGVSALDPHPSDGDDGEDDGRPEDCSCAAFKTDPDLPCWNCWAEGYRTRATEEQ